MAARPTALALALALWLPGPTLAQSKTVHAAGSDTYGEIGSGYAQSYPYVSLHFQINGLENAAAVAAGNSTSYALMADGTVRAWGQNFSGEIGDGSTTHRYLPVQVSGLTDVVAISPGRSYCLALRSDGSVWAWGLNHSGQLGDGTTTYRTVPVQVVGLPPIRAIAGGGPDTWPNSQNAGHSLAVAADGSVWAWGRNYYGQLGDGTTTDRLTPVQVPGLAGMVAVAAGPNFSLALKADGTVWAWGRNNGGQLGDGTMTDRLTPVRVWYINDAVAITCGQGHALALRADGTLWAWGANKSGQLGDTTVFDKIVPVPVWGLSGVTAIAARSAYTMALTADAVLWAWGSNSRGQFGDGSTASSLVPKPIYTTSGVTAIGPGTGHSLIIGDKRTTATTLYTIDRVGTITELMILRAYLRRLPQLTWVNFGPVTFRIDGTVVGAAVTSYEGSAYLDWIVTDGPETRTIQAEYAGHSEYLPSSATATATCQKWTTRMATFDRTVRLSDRTELKARLVRSDGSPIMGRPIRFSVDGTPVATVNTNEAGYARYGTYNVPDEAGAGARTILCEWAGSAGYAAISKTANLTVLRAIPYIWVLPKSVPSGGVANLYAYFRRLYDYRKQEGKPVTFRLDGTWIADATTGSGAADPGVARCLYSTAGLGIGLHTVRCEFAGDAWVEAGYGEATLTIY